ncbi:hypothetical protein KI387_037884, partial [Taxus chinensis]
YLINGDPWKLRFMYRNGTGNSPETVFCLGFVLETALPFLYCFWDVSVMFPAAQVPGKLKKKSSQIKNNSQHPNLHTLNLLNLLPK